MWIRILTTVKNAEYVGKEHDQILLCWKIFLINVPVNQSFPITHKTKCFFVWTSVSFICTWRIFVFVIRVLYSCFWLETLIVVDIIWAYREGLMFFSYVWSVFMSVIIMNFDVISFARWQHLTELPKGYFVLDKFKFVSSLNKFHLPPIWVLHQCNVMFGISSLRIHKDKSFHCEVCNVCLDKRLEGKHKCRPDSGHDECCICLEVRWYFNSKDTLLWALYRNFPDIRNLLFWHMQLTLCSHAKFAFTGRT